MIFTETHTVAHSTQGESNKVATTRGCLGSLRSSLSSVSGCIASVTLLSGRFDYVKHAACSVIQPHAHRLCGVATEVAAQGILIS